MKKLIPILLAGVLALTLAACGTGQPDPTPTSTPSAAPSAEPSASQTEGGGQQTSGGKALVVYYSATGSTKRVAGYIAGTLGADQFELVPVQPYTSEDLSWTTEGSRVNLEHDDESLRDVELMANTVDNWADYDTVFVGYPIWWGIAAWPVNDFVKNNDFTGKTVIPFCYGSQGQKLNLPQLLRSGRRKPSAPFHFCLYASIFVSSSIGGMGGSKCCGGHSPGPIGLSMHPMSR